MLLAPFPLEDSMDEQRTPVKPKEESIVYATISRGFPL
jgi:hypothetical protein